MDGYLLALREAHGTGEATAALDCRLAEKLLHQGRRDDAVECCRRAFPWVVDDAPLLRICAWIFSNSGCHDEAAAAYRALLALSPEWADGYRHLSGALAAAGRLDEAIDSAVTASERVPHDAEFATHAAGLLVAAGRYGEAGFFLDRVLAAPPREWRQVAELLMQCGRAADAAGLLHGTPDAAEDPALLRVLSAAEMLCDRLDAALAAVDGALAQVPDNAEYHIHRGHLLQQLGDTAAAALAFERAAALDPENREVARARMGLFLAAGLVSEATAAGGALLQRFPDDRPAVEAMRHLLSHRLDAIDADYVVLDSGGGREPRQPRPASGLRERLQTQQRVIGALIIRETRTRFGESRLGYGWAVLEPVLHIALLSATFAVLMHGQPPIGRQFFIFYYTGLIPYFVFVHSSAGMSHAITGNGPLLQLPLVTTSDVIAARGVLEFATDIVVALLLLVGFAAIGLDAMPDDLWAPSLALLVSAGLGIGVGYVNAVVTVFFRSWERAYAQVTRVLYFVSGIFYMPDTRGFKWVSASLVSL